MRKKKYLKIFLSIMFFLTLTIQVFAKNITKDIPDVYLGEDNLQYEKGSNIPFTGTVTRICNNVKWLEYNVKNGKDEGLCTEWNFRGTRKMHSIMYKEGVKLWQKSWTPSGKEFYGKYKNDLPWNGVFEEEFPWGAYFESDVPANGRGRKYITFVNGVENGTACWYGEQKNEQLLAEGTYKDGQPWQGQFVMPIEEPPTMSYSWDIKSFQAGVPEGEVYYYAAERVLTPETRGHIVYEMVKQKYSGLYKNGERWQGMFIQKFNGFVWEQLFYEKGKMIRKEYTVIYSGRDYEEAIIAGWLPVKEKKLPENKPGSDNNSAK